MNQDTINQIAREYVAAEHTPSDPSYSAFVAETLQQYRDLIAGGLRVDQIPGTITGSSAELFAELDGGVIRVAVDGSVMEHGHPLDVWVPEFGMTVNTVFRTVHDVNGHYRTRAPFETFEGELQAYRNHAAMYSPEAIPALFGETVGQLCHYYAGLGFVAVQRAAIIPVRTV